ncbi:MAG: L-rhamnose mutarotase [Candidatus Nanopelagicaceae bacterium]|nr:L-rhamnose mutarotase [Candidatus Nanopelagicaceae bacterium]
MSVKRIGQVIGIKPEDIEEYEKLHAQAWPSIIKIIKQANISNYSIFRYGNLLFAYLEYTGSDYEADMAKLADEPEMQRWWKITDQMQWQVPETKENNWWHEIPENFHVD